MPYFPDTSVLGPGAITGVLTGAVALSFSGPAQSASTDTATGIGTVYLSGGANIQNAGSQVGYAGYINFAGTALASVAIATNTATITYNGGGGGGVLVQDEGLNTQNVTLLNFVGTGVTASVAVASTATITINAGAAAAGGPDRSVQFNASTTLTGSNLLDVDLSGNLVIKSLASGTSTLTPAAGNLTIYSRLKAGRNLLSYEGPSGLDGAYQPMIGMNKVAWATAIGGVATAPTVMGVTLATTGGLTTAPISTTNFSSTLHRVDYIAVAGSGSVVGTGGGVATVWLGSRVNEGGFYFVGRCVNFCTGAINLQRFFVGFQTGTAYATTSPSAADPSLLKNMFGVGKDAADTTYQFIHSDAATQVKVNSSITVNMGDVLEVRIFAKPSATQVGMSLEVISVGGSGSVGSGPYADYATTGNLANLPANTQPMSWRMYHSVGDATTVNKIGFISAYIEKDI